MALIFAVSSDPGILKRWSAALAESGRVCTTRTAGTVRDGSNQGALCLFDLGPRGGTDLRPLSEAVAASPDIAFIAMTARPEAPEGLRLLRAGARGYCNRLVSGKVLAALLSTVEAGEIWAGRQVTDFLLHASLEREAASRSEVDSLLQMLTPREAQIAGQVAEGLSNKVIAADSGISERTVKAHLNAIFRKTGLRNRVQLALAISQAPVESRRLSNG